MAMTYLLINNDLGETSWTALQLNQLKRVRGKFQKQ
jgi:hypothetical protein